MNRILVAYASHSGSTQEIAQFMGRELINRGLDMDVLPIGDITDLSAYEVVVAGGLLYRFGWHPEVVRFLQKNTATLKRKQVALFVTGMRLVKTPGCDQADYPIFIDPSIMKPPTEKKGLLDSLATLHGYLHAALPAIEEIHPVSLAFFAGKLDLHTLPWPEKLIMLLLMLLAGKKPGDYRNWEAIRAWVNGLCIGEPAVYRLEDTAVTV